MSLPHPPPPPPPPPPAPPQPAATIVVLRDSGRGPEVLLLRRSQKASFFPHAWVFPGGRVEAADADAPCRGAISGLPEAARAFAVAAIRECFEESGVWLGDGDASPALRDALNGRRASLHDAPHLTADLTRIGLWSHWITPTREPCRYDTRFFITALRPDERAASDQARHDEVETVDSAWLLPEEALAAPDVFLAPPTFLTLRELAAYPSAAAAVDAARLRHRRAILPVHATGPEGELIIALPGDPLHPEATPACDALRVTLHEGRWVPTPLSTATATATG